MPSALTEPGLTEAIRRSLLERNAVAHAFFECEAQRLAVACREMADRFARGGRLLALGRLHSATDAQHVSVEFVHPVIVGKRALPALDLSHAVGGGLASLVRPEDIVMGFGPPSGDPEIADALGVARGIGAQTFALPGADASYGIAAVDVDPYIHQEIIEVLYHTLWETVHVFLEHREAGHDVGASGFLYPYLGQTVQDTTAIVSEVAASIRAKARTDERLREEAAERSAEAIAEAALAVRKRIAAGGAILAFGNGGSATDANDFALDCVVPVKPRAAIPAISLASEPAVLSAIANDVGHETVFLRQVIAHGRRGDVALAISTSGGSANVIAALEEARKRGLLTVALLGYDGGEIVRRGLADLALVVSCDYIPRIQEVQASMYHTLIDAL
jgi:D-sedoheptulose 7-phosphate isomerase